VKGANKGIKLGVQMSGVCGGVLGSLGQGLSPQRPLCSNQLSTPSLFPLTAQGSLKTHLKFKHVQQRIAQAKSIFKKKEPIDIQGGKLTRPLPSNYY
jgi:hypothetical protein